MMKKILFLFPILLFSFDLQKEFIKGNYNEVCKVGVREVFNGKIDHNEKLMSIAGVACAKSNQILYLPIFIKRLKRTKIGRINAIYFSVLTLQKKLLYSYFMDATDISFYKLPITDHPLSIVVYNLSTKNFEKKANKYIIKYQGKIYKVYKKDTRVFIDIYDKNQHLIKSEWYR
jgi:DNA relaxase NicK